MAGQVTDIGAQIALNALTNTAPPVVASSAPGTPIPGQVWVNSSASYALYYYNGTAWVSGESQYLALLTADPATSGPSGGTAQAISDLVEDITAGYARQAITWNTATSAIPSAATNSNVITFGPYTANQDSPVQWAALVTASTGTTGLLLYTWTLDTAQQVLVSQPIIIPVGALVLDQQ